MGRETHSDPCNSGFGRWGRPASRKCRYGPPQRCKRATGSRHGAGMTIPLDNTGCPDLQALVELSGRRHAASIEYVEEPLNRPPHQGGYQHITTEEWAEYD